jgi:phospholipase D1/2
MVPALPGFDGHPADEASAVFRIQVHYIRKTVNEMYSMLKEYILSDYLLDEYLYVFSLRTHALIGDQPTTEIIYIHSKVMIVDDRVALIGSANINDRSLKGCRDTELAVVIEDQEIVEIETEDGQRREVSVFAHELRKELYVEHFGVTAKQAEDYFKGDVWSFIVETAKKNHEIYRLLFGCYPDNEMTDF